MRKTIAIVMTLVVLSAMPVFAELQNVTVGGSIYILSELYSDPLDVDEGFPWQDRSSDNNSFTTQWTKVNVKADFSENVSAFIELDSINMWSRGFRSNYINGMDGRPNIADVQVYQAYIEAREMYGYPVRLRVGRQEVVLGSEWLVGNNTSPTTGLSFDGIRLSYAVDEFTVDAFTFKLADISPGEEDGDVDLYGIYGSYLGLENITIDAYWMLVRDAGSRDLNLGPIGEWFQDVLGVDEFEPSYLHTIGLRGAGTYGAFDFEGEIAFQFGEADAVGSLFGDDDADFDEWGMTLEAGYTFDVKCEPRAYLGFVYLGGEDNRDVDLWEFASNALPWTTPDSSVSFNRLFSDVSYSPVLFGNTKTDLSNVWILRTGVKGSIRENIQLALDISYFEAIEERSIARLIPFLNEDSDDELGWQVSLTGTYNYSEDVCVNAGWTHFFAGDGIEDGNWVGGNGLVLIGTPIPTLFFDDDVDDADYLFVDVTVNF